MFFYFPESIYTFHFSSELGHWLFDVLFAQDILGWAHRIQVSNVFELGFYGHLGSFNIIHKIIYSLYINKLVFIAYAAQDSDFKLYL